MNEMRKLMEAVSSIVEDDDGDISYNKHKGNLARITAGLDKEHDKNVSRILTGKFKGKTVELNVLGTHDGSRIRSWKTISVKVAKVIYQARDVNGPTFVSTDDNRYQSHPDHNVKILDNKLPARYDTWPHLDQNEEN